MAELRPYNPTWRDRIAQVLMGDGRASPERRSFVEGLTGSSGLGTNGIGILDALMVPGAVLGAQEAAQGGDYRGAAMQAMFLGPSARIADKAALAAAEKLAAKGASRDEIWNQTGWFKGADNKWRFEVSDNDIPMKSRATEDELFQYPAVSEVLPHKQLYKAYPEIGQTRLAPEFGEGTRGSYDEAQRVISVRPRDVSDFTPRTGLAQKSTILHELQHGVQAAEGFERGANFDQRRAQPPWMTQDVPDEQQIVRGLFGLGGN
jgi:hypothetical protein